MKIIIPLAGHGSRFMSAGYTFPKPLILVNGKPMIQVVVENLNLPGEYIFICRKEHLEKYSLMQLFQKLQPNSKIITVDKVTNGAAQTVLLAEELINNDEELIIANSDQWIDWKSKHFLSFIHRKKADGGILTFISSETKWSFVKINEDNLVTEVAEKIPISNIATVGIYYYKQGKLFVNAAKKMIEKNVKINNEFYVAPTYNEMIQDGKKVVIYPVAEMQGLGTPEDLKKFLEMDK